MCACPEVSLPARGAWIEIFVIGPTVVAIRRSPHGERGLKLPGKRYLSKVVSRSPHGERGLKLRSKGLYRASYTSLPARGAWIEIGRRGL